MRTSLLAIAIVLSSASAALAQAVAQPAPQSAAAPLPVSLAHIRDGLSRPASPWTLTFRAANFKTEVHELRSLDSLMKSFDFRSGPVPAGGIYMYEQQRLMNNSTNHPLAQPYAAFSNRELFTLGVEGLAEKLTGSPK